MITFPKLPHVFLSALALLGIAGCCAHHTSRTESTTYVRSDFLGKGREPEIPSEFKTGRATLEQVKAWSASLLSYLQAAPSLEIREEDLTGDGIKELLVAESTMHGTGGNTYLIFERTVRGYCYFGKLSFGGIRVLPQEAAAGPSRILTSSGAGGGLVMVSYLTLQAGHFTVLARVPVRAGDSGTDEGNQIYSELFEAEVVSRETLRRAFGIF